MIETIFITQILDHKIQSHSSLSHIIDKMYIEGWRKIISNFKGMNNYCNPIVCLCGGSIFERVPYYHYGSWPSLEWRITVAFIPKYMGDVWAG